MGIAERRLSYVVPFRRWQYESISGFATYLEQLPSELEIILVDGSNGELFVHHAAQLPPRVRHIPIARQDVTPNGKVGGVIEGVRQATHELVVVADDDVRYDPCALDALVAALSDADVVRPQNYFSPRPWHAVWDTGRTLFNRALDGDWPGTLGVRRSAFMHAGSYAGDVLFENLELVRTIRRAGGREKLAGGIYIRRLPPTFAHFREQRVRQAYDEFARPVRLAAFLTLPPLLVAAIFKGAWRSIGAGCALVVGLAEFGRRRDGGAEYFSPLSSLLAPAWLLERAVCSWLALLQRQRGGIHYAGTKLQRASS